MVQVNGESRASWGQHRVGAHPYLSTSVGCLETCRVNSHSRSPLSPTQPCKGKMGEQESLHLELRDRGSESLYLAQGHSCPGAGAVPPPGSLASPRREPSHKRSILQAGEEILSFSFLFWSNFRFHQILVPTEPFPVFLGAWLLLARMTCLLVGWLVGFLFLFWLYEDSF